MHLSNRILSAVLALAGAVAVTACEDTGSFRLALSPKLRTAELTPERQALLRAELEIPGLLAPTALIFDDARAQLAGAFVLAVQEESTLPVSLRVFGRLSPKSAEVLLGVAKKNVTFRPREAARLELVDEDWRVGGAAVFDPNGNGAPSVDDLVNGFDPAPPGVVLDVSPGDLQFASGVRPGEFTRQVVVVENVSGLPQTLSAEIVGGQGMSIVRVDATGTPDVGAPRALEPFTLQPFAEQLLAVTFAPTNGFLVRGGLALHTLHEDSGVSSVREVGLFANSDGDPQPVLAGYDPGTVAAAALGFDGEVLAYPPALLFGGQPLAPGTIPLSLEPNDVLVVDPLGYPTSSVGGLPASAVFLVQIPPRHRISVELSGLVDDADLGLFLLEDAGEALSAAAGEALISANAGTSPEIAQFRNTSSSEARRALIVVGRVDGREEPGTAAADDDVVPFQLLAQLNAGPELTDDAPIAPLRAEFRGGSEVTIQGIAFEPGATVRFGTHLANRAQTVVEEDGTRVRTVAPQADESDVGTPLVVVVVNPDGQAATHPPIFVYDPPAPVIDDVDPPTANVNGGTPLVVTGAFFSGENGGPNVLIGGTAATDVVLAAPNRITATAPPGVVGFTTLVVENVSDQGEPVPSASFPFVYVVDEGEPPAITAVDPAAGSVDGGEALTISGSGFADAASVRVGGTAASAVAVVDATTITCITPPGVAAGAVDVVVINPDGRAATAVGAFTYVTPAPRLIDSVPDFVSENGGTRLFIDGGDLRPGLQAFFRQNDVTTPAAGLDFVSSSRIIVTSPLGLTAGPAEVFVVNPDAQASAGLAVTVVAPAAAPPRILSLNPAVVRTDNLVAIDVVGSGFDASLILFIDDEVVPTTALTTTSFRFAPPLRAPGAAIVRVVNGDGQTDADALIYEAPFDPVFTAVVPELVGALVPGDVVTLAGANLTSIPAEERAARVRLENGAGTAFASTVLEQTSTTLRLRIDDELPEGADYRVVVDFPPVVSSPTFAAIAPVVLSHQVVAGSLREGAAFSLLLQGVSLNKDRIGVVRFTLPQDGGPDLVVDVAPSVRTNGLVRVEVAGDALAQGAWQVSLVYGFTNAAGQPDSLVVAAPGDLVIAGECGNGVLDAGEQCDTVDLAGLSCADVGFFGGTLGCSAACALDTRRCDRCGDGIIDAADGEECDGGNLGGATCAELIAGSTSGTPGCSTQCQLVAGSCATCGNGIAEGGEQCDGTDLQGATCATLGFNAGQLGCDPALCILDGAQCSTCGNNRCDVLETTANCAADCAATCGNGICDASESCTTCPRDCGGQCTGPFSLALASGGGQSSTFSRDLAQPLVVRATDAANAPLVGLQITFTPPAGGEVSPRTVLTDANGNASTLATLPRTVGATSYSATGTGPDAALLAGAPLAISATSADLAAARIVTVLNQAGVAGRQVLLDAGGNDAPAAASKSRVNLDSVSASGVVVRPSDGSIFVADTSNHRVVRIAPDGRLFHVAGSDAGTAGFVDNTSGVAARFSTPRGLALDADENLYVADSGNNRVRKIDALTGNVTTFAGGGTSLEENVLATTAQLFVPAAVAFAPDGAAFILNNGGAANDNIRKVAPNQTISTVVSTGSCSTNNLRANILDNTQIALDPQGRLLFIGEVSNIGGCPVAAVEHVLRLETNGTLTSVAGGTIVVTTGTAFGAQLLDPTGLASDGAGNVYVTERQTTGRRLRKISALGVISTIAGSAGVAATASSLGDGGPASAALLHTPGFLSFGPGGDLVVADNGLHHVRLLRAIAENTPPVIVATPFGGGQTTPTNNALGQPLGLTVHDSNDNPIAGVTVSVVAAPGSAAEPSFGVTDGNGTFSFVGFVGRAPGPYTFSLAAVGVDGLPLSGSPFAVTVTAIDTAPGIIQSVLDQPGTVGNETALGAATRLNVNLDNFDLVGMAVDPDDGTLYVSDAENDRVLKISPAGEVSQVAGTGGRGRGGNGPALSIALDRPRGLALDADKNLFIADSANDYVRILTPDGNLTIFAGNALNATDPADGLVATGANLNEPSALALAPDGDLVIVDESFNRIRRVEIDPAFPTLPGVISSVVVSASCTTNNLRVASLNNAGLAFDAGGRLYFTGTVSNAGGCPVPDPNGDYVFRLEDNGSQTAIAGGATAAASGPAFGTRLLGPSGVAVDAAGNLYLVERGGHRVRRIDTLGSMVTVVGDGVAGFVNDNIAASAARIDTATGLAFDAAGNLYIASGNNNRVRVVRALGLTVPSTASISIVGGDAQTGTIGQIAPEAIRVKIVDGNNDPVVNLPVTFTALDPGDTVTQRVVSTTIVGEAGSTVRLGRSDTTPHRVQALARTWLDPIDIVDGTGAVPVFTLTATRPASGSTVAIVNSQGLAGNVVGGAAGIAATEARVSLNISGVALAADGTLLFSDSNNHRVLAVSPEGHLSTFAGTGVSGFLDNVPATDALLDTPRGLAIDAAGNVYIADASGTTNRDRLRRVGLDGVITTIAGGAADTPGHGDGAGTAVNFNDPRAVAIGPDGFIYVVDAGFNNIRRVDPVSPHFTSTQLPDGTSCSAATGLVHHDITDTGLAWDDQDRLYFVATTNNASSCPTPVQNVATLFRQELDGSLTFLVGGFFSTANQADGNTGTNILLNGVGGLHIDAGGNLIYAETNGHRIRRIPSVATTPGAVTTIVGQNLTAGFGSLTAPGAGLLSSPVGLVVDPVSGDLYWTENGSHAVRLLQP